MVGLLLLKQTFNQGDETVVAARVQNLYWQCFCGMTYLTGDLAYQDAAGRFHHLGRVDNHVKILGNRV
jgi:acyl-coenzyme A synthetase/AMP-(fatty) acid ligase